MSAKGQHSKTVNPARRHWIANRLLGYVIGAGEACRRRLFSLSGVGFLPLALLLFPAATAGGTGSFQEQPPQDAWVVRGSQLIAAGQVDEALALFANRKADAPLDARPYFFSGLALTQREDWGGASAELQEALRLDSQNLESQILYGNALSRLGHISAAVDLLEPLAESDRLDSLANAWLWLLSDTFFRSGANDESMAVLNRLAERSPNDPRVALNMGQIQFMNGNLEAARTSLEKSTTIQPNHNAAAYFELGKVLQQQGQGVPAEEAFRRAVTQDPGNAEYSVKLAAALLGNGKAGEAVATLEPLQDRGESIPEIFYVLGHSYQALKNRQKAQELLAQFQEFSEAKRRGQYQRIVAGKLVGKGEEALDQGDKVAAEDWFRKAVEEDPKSWVAHGYLAELYLASGSVFLGCNHAERMLAIDPDHPVSLFLAARCRFQRGETEEALQLALRVREMRPGNADLRNLIGNIFLKLGRFREAVTEYEAAVELAPERQDFGLNLATAQKRLEETGS